MATIELKINNWEKHNPRSDQKKHYWFRMSVDALTDPVIFKMSHEEFRVWIYLLSERTKKGEEWFTIDTAVCRRITRVRTNSIRTCHQLLTQSNKIETRGSNDFLSLDTVCDTDPCATYVRTDKTNKSIKDTGEDARAYEPPKAALTIAPPLKPKSASEQIALEKRIKSESVAITTLIVGAFRKFASSEREFEAFEYVGEMGWKIIMTKYHTWDAFCLAYHNAWKAKKDSYFEYQIQQIVEAFLTKLAYSA